MPKTSAAGAKALRLVRAEKRANTGGKLKVSFDPPAFTQMPWWNITLSDTVSTSAVGIKTYTGVEVYGLLRAQTGLPHKAPEHPIPVSLRILAIYVWGRDPNTSVSLQVNDLTIGFAQQDYLIQIEDQPSISRNARLGYSLPRSQQLVILSGDDTEKICSVSTSVQAKIIVRFRIMWKPRFEEIPNLTALARVLKLEQDLAQLKNKIASSSGEK